MSEKLPNVNATWVSAEVEDQSPSFSKTRQSAPELVGGDAIEVYIEDTIRHLGDGGWTRFNQSSSR
jgi:hypothetical protein